MKIGFLQKIFYSFTGLATFCLLMPSAMAIGIHPLRNELNVKPGGSAESEVIVVNETAQDFMAEPVLKVFYKNNEAGFPVYPTGEEQDGLNGVEDFLSWIEISEEPVFVPAKSEVKVPYTVTVPRRAKGGGRYATIAYQPVIENSGGVMVNVRAASLLYVNVNGKMVHSGEVTSFGLPEELMGDKPFTFNVSFLNTGNTHLKPTGWIEVTDLTTGNKLIEIGKYVDLDTHQIVVSDAIPVNAKKSCVLPGSSRIFMGEWNEGLKAGRYRADLKLTYAEGAEPIARSVEFEVEKGGLEIAVFSPDVPEKANAFNLKVVNHGKVYEKIRGAIEIRDPFGSKVAEIIIPEDIGYVAPGETRSFSFDWLNKDLPNDRFTARLKANYGFLHEPLVARVSFGELASLRFFLSIVKILAIFVGVIGVGIFFQIRRRRTYRKSKKRKVAGKKRGIVRKMKKR